MINEKIKKELEFFDEDNFILKKINSLSRNFELVQDIFSFNQLKAYNECATYLKYALFRTKKNKFEKKLIYANFCKNRWCSVCNWRRSLKYRTILNNRIKIIKQQYNAKFIFLTLTIKNTHYKNLKKDLKLILNAFNRMFNYLFKVNPAILGYVRSLEFTVQKDNLEYFNLHIHTLISVTPGYFDTKKNNYINQKKWAELWQKYLKVDYTPVVDVRLVKKRKKSRYSAEELAVMEVVKYVLKDLDLYKLQKSKRVDIFKELYKSFKNVRNLSFGGVFTPKNFKNENEKKEEDLIKVGNEVVKGQKVAEVEYILKDRQYKLKKIITE